MRQPVLSLRQACGIRPGPDAPTTGPGRGVIVDPPCAPMYLERVRKISDASLFARATMKTVTRLAAALLLCIALGAAIAQDAPPEPTEKKIDPWKAYVLTGKWEEGKLHYRQGIVAMCTGEKQPDIKLLAELHYGYTVCHYFPRIEDGLFADRDRQRLTQWLLANKEFTQKFLLALTPNDDAGRAFAVAYELLKFSEKAVRQFPDLAIAFAVVWDRFPEDQRALCGSFAYFTASNARMQLDLRTVPPEVSKYIVDTQRSLSERKWALDKYANYKDIDKLYNKIWVDKYDYDALLKGKRKKVDIVGDSLPNILKYGGVCREAAIFASEVGKATGCPAVYVHGPTEGGVGHAWVGYLRKEKDRHVWDCETGRLADESVSAGTVLDPQAGREVSEHELDYALAVLRYPEEMRRRARIWCDAAAILLDADQGARAKATMYESLNTCVYDRAQWLTFAEIAKKTDLSEDVLLKDLGKLCDQLKDYPNLVVDAFAALAEAVDPKSEKLRLSLYEYMAKRSAGNPETYGRTRLLQGRYLESVGKHTEAINVYANAALKVLRSKKAMMALLDNASRLMIKRGAAAKAAGLHAQVFKALGQPRRSTAATVGTTWFQVGLRLAKLYRLADDRAKHDQVLGRIMHYQEGSKPRLQAMSEWLHGLNYYEINTTRPALEETR